MNANKVSNGIAYKPGRNVIQPVKKLKYEDIDQVNNSYDYFYQNSPKAREITTIKYENTEVIQSKGPFNYEYNNLSQEKPILVTSNNVYRPVQTPLQPPPQPVAVARPPPQPVKASTAATAAAKTPAKRSNRIKWIIGIGVLAALAAATALTLGLVFGLRNNNNNSNGSNTPAPSSSSAASASTSPPAPGSTASGATGTGETTGASGTSQTSNSPGTTSSINSCRYGGFFDAITKKCNCINDFTGPSCEIKPDCNKLPNDSPLCAQLLNNVDITKLTDESVIGNCPKSTFCLLQSLSTSSGPTNQPSSSSAAPQTSSQTTTAKSSIASISSSSKETTVTAAGCRYGGIFDISKSKCNCPNNFSGNLCEIKPNCATLTNDPVECDAVIAEHKLNNQPPVDEFTQGACPKYFLCTI